jgi:high-affinity iron transporter
MLGALIIVFREVIEAGLIVGIVMAATRGVAGRGFYVTGGVAGGVVGAALVALFAGQLSDAFDGSGQELFNAGVLALAVLMLTWHNVWMSRHGREIAAEMRGLGAAVSAGQRSLMALAIVVGVAVLREGAEVVLFLYGIVASGTNTGDLLTGGLLGLAGGAALSALTYGGLIAIPSRHIFTVTSAMIALLAAGMAAQAVQFADSAGLIDVGSRAVWDSSWLLSEGSLFGRMLHTLVGYTERPSFAQLVVYIATLAITAILMRLARPTPSAAKRASISHAPAE